jgi:hypothetical protein
VFDRRSSIVSSSQPSNSKSSVSSSSSATSDSSAGALLAWGPSADSRWKELVAVAEAEDAMANPDGGGKTSKDPSKKIRRRRPLLLFFPSHNQASPLAAYRSFALVHR